MSEGIVIAFIGLLASALGALIGAYTDIQVEKIKNSKPESIEEERNVNVYKHSEQHHHKWVFKLAVILGIIGLLFGGIIVIKEVKDTTLTMTPMPEISPIFALDNVVNANITSPDGASIDLLHSTNGNIKVNNCYRWQPEVSVAIQFTDPPSSCNDQTKLYWVFNKNGRENDGHIFGKADTTNEKICNYLGEIDFGAILSEDNTQVFDLILYIEINPQADNPWNKNLLDDPIQVSITCTY